MSEPSMHPARHVSILGVRGVPAAHGGFETFAARLAPVLSAGGWRVSVYCQEEETPHDAASETPIWESTWEGVTRIHIAIGHDTPANSIRFDWKCISDVIKRRPDVVLMLGYNTAVFSVRLRLAGIPTVINMDGMEWMRAKWSMPAKIWLYLNERAGCTFGDHLIADHPQIERHLLSRVTQNKVTVVPYGAEILDPSDDDAILRSLGVKSRGFLTLIARPEPENSILDIVRAFSAKRRGIHLVILGKYHPEEVEYHARVKASASAEVLFLGAIYDKFVVHALRRHCLFYLHGHRVGGCNPSLLEAMGAGNAVLAHDNRFNRWVVGDGAHYFVDASSCERAIDRLLQPGADVAQLGALNRRRAIDIFDWRAVLQSYAEVLTDVVSRENLDAAQLGWGRRPYWSLDTKASADAS